MKVRHNMMDAYQRVQPRRIYHRIHMVPSHAVLVTVCLLMLPLLVLAAENVHLNITHHMNPMEHLHPCHMTIRRAQLTLLPHVDNVIPAIVLQNYRPVQLNIGCSAISSSVRCVSPSPRLGVPYGLERMVTGVILHLLILSGDIETNPGPVGQLTLNDLSDVRGALYEARVKWYHIGVGLKLSAGTLDAIRSEFFNTNDCLTEMCKYWLRRIDPSPSWEALTQVLESPPVGEEYLAQQLNEKYCQGKVKLKAHVYTTGISPLGALPTLQVPLCKSPGHLYEEYKLLWNDRPLRIVISGQQGNGKSTLINNFLGLWIREAAKTGKTGKPVTKTVRLYQKCKKGINVVMFDTPGLADPRIRTEQLLHDIYSVTRGEVDLLYYCVSLRAGRLNQADLEAFKLLSKFFGEELWESTVFVLTFANEECGNDYYLDLVENLTEEARNYLKLAGVSNKKAQTIPVTVAGNGNPILSYRDSTEENWIEELFVKSLKMAKPRASPALLCIKMTDEKPDRTSTLRRWRRRRGKIIYLLVVVLMVLVVLLVMHSRKK